VAITLVVNASEATTLVVDTLVAATLGADAFGIVILDMVEKLEAIKHLDPFHFKEVVALPLAFKGVITVIGFMLITNRLTDHRKRMDLGEHQAMNAVS
jgi:hypothetical protein